MGQSPLILAYLLTVKRHPWHGKSLRQLFCCEWSLQMPRLEIASSSQRLRSFSSSLLRTGIKELNIQILFIREVIVLKLFLFNCFLIANSESCIILIKLYLWYQLSGTIMYRCKRQTGLSQNAGLKSKLRHKKPKLRQTNLTGLTARGWERLWQGTHGPLVTENQRLDMKLSPGDTKRRITTIITTTGIFTSEY